MVFFSLFFILLISSAFSQEDTSCTETKDFLVYGLDKETCIKYKDDSLKFNYTYALGVGRDDDMDTGGGCATEEDATLDPESMSIGQIKNGENIKLKIYGHADGVYDNCKEYSKEGFICNIPDKTYKFDTCGWDLSVPKDSCYFLAQEHDPAPEMPPDRKTDDCMGWKMPVGTIIETTAGKLTGESILQKISSTTFSDQKFSKFFDDTDLFSGDWSPTDDGDAACIMKKLFGLKNTAYLCSKTSSEEAVWFICDSLSKGKFIKKDETTNYLCEKGDSGFKWTPTALDCESIENNNGDCDKNMIACVNTYGEKETKDDGTIIGGAAWNEQAGCCGDDGLEDLGKISADEKYLCSHEETLGTVSTPPEDSNSFTKDNIKDLSPEGWRWVDASKGNFKIHDLGPTNRILSNNNKWFKCNATNKGPLKENTAGTPLEQTNSRRFYCVGEGDHGLWKECLIEGTPEEGQIGNPLLTQVGTGDNLYTLYLPESKLIPKEGTVEEDSNIKFSKSAYPAESGETVLLYKWIGNPYSVLIQNEVEPKVKVVASGKNFDLEDANLLDYANVPYLKENGIIEAVLPGIVSPDIYSSIPVSFLKVFQRTSIENEGPFCSGKTSGEPGTNSWITTLDNEKGQLACEANGYTWTGKQCCEVGDYYLNGTVTLSDKEEQILTPIGCWNGITLEEGDSIGEISFNINAQGKITTYKLEQNYPCKKEKDGEKCRYFIKGIIEEGKAIEDVTLTNLFPEKYDLVARAFNEFEPGIKKEILITANGVKINRNKYYLEAKNVPAMAIVGKNKEGQGTFLGCGQSLTQVSNTEMVPLCITYQDNYCSPHGWTNKAPAKFNFNQETKEYEPTEEVYEPAVFDHSGSIVFGRNLFPNANFVLDEKGNPKNWQKASQGALKVEKEKLFFQGELVSSPLYLEKDDYLFSFTSNCNSNDFFGIYLSDNPSSDSVTGPELKVPLSKEYTEHGEWRSYYEYSPEAGKYWLKLLSKEKECSLGEPILYRNQGTLTPFNYDELHQPITTQQCCPENSCWNGFTCVEDMSLQTEREETVAEGVSYRCLKGNWTAQEKKWDWANKVQGYCEKETQCFVAPITPTGDAQGATAGVAAKEFYDGGVTPSCINDSEFIFDHYCQEGEWTTRTKFLITALQNLAQNNSYPKYSIYCSPYKETLNDYGSAVYDVEQFIGGSEDYTKLVSDPGCQFKKDDPACQTTGKLCFSGANSNLVPNEENTCVNNFCLLTHEEDKQQKTIFGVSLNQPIDDTSNSFLRSLGIDTPDEIQSYCPTEGDDWVDCQNTVGFLKYHPQLNIVAYSSEEFAFEPGTLANIWAGVKDAVGGAIDFIGGLLGFEVDKVAPGQLPEPLKDKTATNAFTTCPAQDTSRYFSFFGNGKSAVACVWNNTLSASYYNFVTPICDFADHVLEEKKKITQEETTEIIPLQGQSAYLCTEDTLKIAHLKINNPNNFAFWWPQLTGRLRIN